MSQAVAKEGLECEGNVPAQLSYQALSVISTALLKRRTTAQFKVGIKSISAKL